MARRNRGAGASLIELFAKMPWWMGVALAGILYLGLHHYASRPATAVLTPGKAGDFVSQAYWKSIASGLQYVLPALCLIGAGVSAFRRQNRKQLFDTAAHGSAAAAINDMSWQQFERLVGEAFRRQGYQVKEQGGNTADGGVDLLLRRNGEKHLVQCKQWRAVSVGVDVVRELYGVMAARGAASGFVVTSGRFTAAALQFAEGRNIQLVGGDELHGWIKSDALEPAFRSNASDTKEVSASVPQSVGIEAPACPTCSAQMVRRVAKRGQNAGGAFWGCSAYPSCKGTRPYTS